MKYYQLFLDDVRNLKAVSLYKQNPVYTQDNWVVVRTYEQFIGLVSENFAQGLLPSLVSFDHDLVKSHYVQGVLTNFASFDENKASSPTGWHALAWFLKFHQVNDLALPEILFHSKNNGGVSNMKALLDEYNNFKH